MSQFPAMLRHWCQPYTLWPDQKQGFKPYIDTPIANCGALPFLQPSNKLDFDA